MANLATNKLHLERLPLGFKSFWETKLIFEQKRVFILSEEEHLGKGENQQCYTIKYHVITTLYNTIQ